MHERDDLHPDPTAFRPERFLNTRPGTNTWLPFGGGVYRCVGAEFVLFEARVLLRTLLQHRRLARSTVDPAAAPAAHTLCRCRLTALRLCCPPTTRAG